MGGPVFDILPAPDWSCRNPTEGLGKVVPFAVSERGDLRDIAKDGDLRKADKRVQLLHSRGR
jgi:hypothetical protein